MINVKVITNEESYKLIISGNHEVNVWKTEDYYSYDALSPLKLSLGATDELRDICNRLGESLIGKEHYLNVQFLGKNKFVW